MTRPKPRSEDSVGEKAQLQGKPICPTQAAWRRLVPTPGTEATSVRIPGARTNNITVMQASRIWQRASDTLGSEQGQALSVHRAAARRARMIAIFLCREFHLSA